MIEILCKCIHDGIFMWLYTSINLKKKASIYEIKNGGVMCAQLVKFAECLILIHVIFPNLIYNYARSINPLILYIKLYVEDWQSLKWIQSKKC